MGKMREMKNLEILQILELFLFKTNCMGHLGGSVD